MKRMWAMTLCVAVIMMIPGTALGADVMLGKCTANLASAASNNYSVTWYTIGSPYSPYTYGMQNPPYVLKVTTENVLKARMDYQMRDDSMVRGKSQSVNMQVLHWDPYSFSWISEGSTGQSKGSATYGRYNMTGVLEKQTWWGSSSYAVKYQVKADARSGDATTDYRYFWVVRQPSNTAAAYQAGPRYICSRYDRSALYKEMGKTWREMGTNPAGDGFKQGMDNIITISKGFLVPTKQDMVVQSGLDAWGVCNILWNYSSVSAEAIGATGVIYQGFTWVVNAVNLLGPGLKDAVVSAVSPSMTQNAAYGASSLATSLETVANASRDEAIAMQNVIYGSGSVFTWNEKLQAEKTAIDNALISLTNARSSVNTYLNGFSNYSSVGYGVGSGTSAAAEAVRTQLANYLNGVENQLKFDQALVNRAIAVGNGQI